MAAEDENKRTKERCKRFTERVNANITEAGKLAQHMIKASGSPDVCQYIGVIYMYAVINRNYNM